MTKKLMVVAMMLMRTKLLPHSPDMQAVSWWKAMFLLLSELVGAKVTAYQGGFGDQPW